MSGAPSTRIQCALTLVTWVDAFHMLSVHSSSRMRPTCTIASPGAGGSFAIVAFLIGKLTRELEPAARATLIGTAVVVFIYRAIPSTGEGFSWWIIDVLGFDQQFLALLSLISSLLTILGMFIFRRFMAERSIAYVIGVLTVAGFVLGAPYIGMYYGMHEWTASVTGGVVDARFIALINTAVESPLGQIAMIPMLAWIANSAPEHLKATFFAGDLSLVGRAGHADRPLTELGLPPAVVGPGATLSDALNEMLTSRYSLAVVVDDQGGYLGVLDIDTINGAITSMRTAERGRLREGLTSDATVVS